MTMETTPKAHLGRNVRRVRDMIGVSQEALAEKLGKEWSQKRVSLLEGREEIEDELLSDVAKALEVPVSFIRQFDTERIICNVQNNYDGSNQGASVTHTTTNNNCTINSIEELRDSYKKMEDLSEKVINEQGLRIELQAALLKEKDEKIAMMQKMLDFLERNK